MRPSFHIQNEYLFAVLRNVFVDRYVKVIAHSKGYVIWDPRPVRIPSFRAVVGIRCMRHGRKSRLLEGRIASVLIQLEGGAVHGGL